MPELSDLDEAAAGTAALRTSLRELNGLADDFGRTMTTAFKRSVVDGKRLQDVLRSMALSLSGQALNRALAPIGKGIGGLLSSLLGGGRVTPFAKGGVVATPSYFPLGGGRGGAGLMGEAGPEAILPLARGPDGRLGVRSGGGGGVNVTFNVQARDADSFRRAEAELTAMLARAVARGQRGL